MLPVTVVIPVKNEVKIIAKTLDALFLQTKQPAEIIITDGGSTDGTNELIEQIIIEHPYVKLLSLEQAYPGKGRNHSIKHANSSIIACVDAGCFPQDDWLEKLIQPLNNGYDVVIGYVKIDSKTDFQESVSKLFFPLPDQVSLNNPPWIGGNIAFLKIVWEEVGGFPEDLRAAEDFIFWERIKSKDYNIGYAPEAIITWDQPVDLKSYFKQQVRYVKWMTLTGHKPQETLIELVLAIIIVGSGLLFNPYFFFVLLLAPLGYVALRFGLKFKRLQSWLTLPRFLWVIILLVTKPLARIIGVLSGGMAVFRRRFHL